MIFALSLLLSPSVKTDVVYSKVGTQELKMDIYQPLEKKPMMPAIVVIHGGGWIGGNKRDMKPLCDSLAKQGMVAASVQYRLAPTVKWPGFYDDVQTAVRYLRQNSKKLGIDPKRIGSAGASAGGHLALLLGFTDTRDKDREYSTHSSRVSAVLDIFGPTDMARHYPPSFDILFATVIGKPKAQSAAEIKAASPVNFIDRLSAPVFIVHGTADQVVPIAQSKWLEEKLKLAKIPVIARYINGMKHEIPQTADVLKTMEEGISWLKMTLTK